MSDFQVLAGVEATLLGEPAQHAILGAADSADAEGAVTQRGDPLLKWRRWADAGALEKRVGDHQFERDPRHQRVHKLERLALGNGVERGVRADRGKVDVAGVERRQCAGIATRNRRPAQA